MKDLTAILIGLRQTHTILTTLVREVPEDQLTIRRIPDKWSIHEQVCHLADVQGMLLERMQRFETEDPYEIQPFIPGDTVSDAHLRKMEIPQALAEFKRLREAQLEWVESVSATYWDKTALHPQYRLYTPLILLRHVLMHDHFHLYRIEELWLTEEAYL